MKHTITLCAFLLNGALLYGQGAFRDPDNDMADGNTVFRESAGQLLTTTGNSVNGMAARSEGPKVNIYCGKNSDLHYVWRSVHADSGMADTSFHIRMRVSGEMAANVTPDPEMLAPGVSNHYHGTSAITGVQAYHAYQYANVNPYTDMRVYHGRYGPKLAFIFNPYSDPDDLFLQFSGQDSLKVDIYGILKLYINGQWIRMDPAIAYQIQNGDVVPITWQPEYVTYQGQNMVHFAIGEYDPDLPLVLRISAPPPPAPPYTPAEPRNLGWSTYMGSDQGDEFMATGVDNNGDAYFCGYSNDINFPTNTGYQVFASNVASLQGNHDAVVAKFDHTYKRVQWTTYLGGSEVGVEDFADVGIDQAHDLAVYRGTNPDLEYVFVTGTTGCNDFPTPHLLAFADAVNQDWTCSSTMYHAAFITAFTIDDGQLHWGNTLGAGAGYFWTAEGLGVDVNEQGRVAWCGRLSQVFGGSSFDFNPVTPSGAFTQAAGGGFFASFNADYTYEWKTPFGTQCSNCGAYDVKLLTGVHSLNAELIGTAVESGTGSPVFDLATHSPTGYTGFYQAACAGGTDAYNADLSLDDYSVGLCTYWGGTGNEEGYALSVNSNHLWLGGSTTSTSLNAAHLPGSGGIHDNTSGGGKDAFLLEAYPIGNGINWGSLYGGAADETILDIDQNGNNVYLMGTTASQASMLFADNAQLFRQDALGNEATSTSQDAVLLCLHKDTKESFWSTYYGGYWSDRGWGVAASDEELYLCGGTRSDQTTFPLREWNPGAPEDWYDGDLTNNIGGNNGWLAYNSEYFPYDGSGMTHDGFMVAFDAPVTVGVNEPLPTSCMQARLIDPSGIWALDLTKQSYLLVCDASGRLVRTINGLAAGQVLIDLRPFATGVYAVRCMRHDGSCGWIKLLKE